MNENNDQVKNNQRSLSFPQRNKNKVLKNKENILFVKKKVKGSLKNTFILSKTDSQVQHNNSCCYYGEYPQQQINFNPNNSMGYGSSNYEYNK